MENVFLKLVTSDLIKITKPKNNKLISYGSFFDIKLIYSLVWIYKYYFEENVLLFLPKIVDIEQTLIEFNQSVGDFPLTTSEVSHCSLEAIEHLKTKVVIYGFGDLIFNELVILNKRRLSTQIKNFKYKIHILSYTSLKCLDIIPFDSFEYFQIEKPVVQNLNYIDTESIVDFISENPEKRIYICINLPGFMEIEKSLKENGIVFSRKENENIVLHTPKIIEKMFLKCKYDIYIFITKYFDYPLDILYYLKECSSNSEIYMDSEKNKNINNSIKSILNEQITERTNIKDSKEYSTYNDLVKDIDESQSTVVSDFYYKFNSPENILSMDLQNLSKKEYDTIRNFVKIKLTGKLDLDVKTCQLSAPCSPKDRSKKLNSLSNKISSYDYRCDVTCEIFKDYTIGVVLWNEMFSNRKSLTVLKNQIFIHQTTNGNWKYTIVQALN
jgi:hypothetical protein